MGGIISTIGSVVNTRLPKLFRNVVYEIIIISYKVLEVASGDIAIDESAHDSISFI